MNVDLASSAGGRSSYKRSAETCNNPPHGEQLQQLPLPRWRTNETNDHLMILPLRQGQGGTDRPGTPHAALSATAIITSGTP